MRRTYIERYASQYGFTVVMPTTQLGCYTDTVYGVGALYQDEEAENKKCVLCFGKITIFLTICF